MQRLKELKEIYKGFNVFGDIDFQSSFSVMPDIRKDDNDDNEYNCAERKNMVKV